jgi:hypothetical protein
MRFRKKDTGSESAQRSVKELVLLLLKEFSYFTATHQMTKMSIPRFWYINGFGILT